MGLDMYLSAKKYVSGYEHSGEESRKQFEQLLTAAGIDAEHSDRCNSPSCELEVNVAYWRKANQIHQWFVKHVQDGKDECLPHYVSREQLTELVKLCKEVLDSIETVEGDVSTGYTLHPDGTKEEHTKRGTVVAQQAIAESQLPTSPGFFFGSTDYDEYYIQDLNDTVKMLEAVLADERLNGWGFEYCSSW